MKTEFNSEDVQIIEKSLMYQGHVTLLKYSFRFRLYQGGWSEIVSRECFQASAAVGILLFDPVRDEIILVEQLRVGAFGAQYSPWLLEVVAGVVEPNEPVVEVARRESIEEAGCEIIDLIPICEYLTSPGISTNKFNLFCGRVTQAHPGGVFGLAHEHEDIRAHVLPKKLVYDYLKTNQINNASTIIAVQWLLLNEHEVKKQWQ